MVYFILLFLLILVAINLVRFFGIPFTGHEGEYGYVRDEAFKSLTLMADLKEERLQRVFKERYGDTEVCAGNDMVRQNVALLRAAIGEFAEQGLDEKSLWKLVRKEKSYKLISNYFNKLESTYGAYTCILIADARNGTILASTEEQYLGISLSEDDCFSAALQSGEVVATEVVTCPRTHRLAVHFGQALKDVDLDTLAVKAGRYSAVLVMEMDPNIIIKPLLHTGEGLGIHDEALLVNEDAKIVTTLKHSLPDGSQAKPLEYRIQATPAMLAARGEAGVIEIEDYRNEPVLAAYRHIRITPQWGWGMVVKRDRDELFAPLRQEIFYTFVLEILGMVALVGCTVLISRRITGPILSLSQTADRVAGGDFNVRAPVTSDDEIGTLTLTFNRMVKRIQHWHKDLEEQVTARTAKLNQVNTELQAEIAERKQAEVERERLLHDTGERVRELNCMFGVAESIRKRKTLKEIFRDVAALLPSGWRYTEIAHGRVRFDGVDYVSEPFEETEWRQLSDIVVNGERRGVVEVYYLEERPELDEGPFVTQERDLIDGIAHTLGEAIGRRLAEEALLDRRRREREFVETELSKVREELVSRTRLAALGQLAGSIAHELRNPLGSVRNAAYFLRSTITSDNPKIDKHLQIIEDEVNTCDHIISELLDMARSKEPEKVELDLAEMVDSAWSRIKVPDTVKRHLEFDPDPFTVYGDIMQLRQVLVNTLLNAQQAMEGRGEISVTARRDSQYDEIVIHDTGPGVSEEHRDKIFDVLFSTKAKGTGLGLSICKQIVERHGGTIELLGADGPGAAFCIRLPRKV